LREGNMAIYVDSAELEEVRDALSSGFVRGVTTNPSLIARTGRKPEEIIAAICELWPEELLYQPFSVEPEEAKEELERIRKIAGLILVPKIPATWEGLKLLAELAGKGWRCALTAVYSPSQALLAREAGAVYVIPYVNRATRQGIDGLELVAQLHRVLQGSGVQIIAASLKSVEEALAVMERGAHHVTVPWAVLKAMADHPLSLQAVEEFAQASKSFGEEK